jgi:hypothetical protein
VSASLTPESAEKSSKRCSVRPEPDDVVGAISLSVAKTFDARSTGPVRRHEPLAAIVMFNIVASVLGSLWGNREVIASRATDKELERVEATGNEKLKATDRLDGPYLRCGTDSIAAMNTI